MCVCVCVCVLYRVGCSSDGHEGQSGSAKILEAILFLRKGFSSSAPKEILEAPPGGRNTLQDMGQKNDYNYTQ